MRLKYFLAAALLSAPLAHADTVTFTLLNPVGHVPASGGTVIYDATVFAPASNGAAVFLNGDSFNVAAPATLNDNDFFGIFPLSLAPGISFTGDLFTLTLPSGAPLSTYLGTFTLLGGANGNAIGTLGTVNFSISNAPLAATPEPSSIALLSTGLLGVVSAFRRRLA